MSENHNTIYIIHSNLLWYYQQCDKVFFLLLINSVFLFLPKPRHAKLVISGVKVLILNIQLLCFTLLQGSFIWTVVISDRILPHLLRHQSHHQFQIHHHRHRSNPVVIAILFLSVTYRLRSRGPWGQRR